MILFWLLSKDGTHASASKSQMRLTPFRIVVLLVSTLVFSTAGVVLIVIGVHGPQMIAWIGYFLLLPNIMLLKLGVPIAIPFIRSASIISVIVFVVLQAGYYYALFGLVRYVACGVRGRTPA